MKKNIREIYNYVSGDRMLTRVREISNFHRIQASTGYRSAAEYCLKALKAEGFDSRIKTYAADGRTWFLTSKMFNEWNCNDAYCDLEFPVKKRIADFKANNISVIQRSYPCDYRNSPLDVVMLEKGPDEKEYSEIDLKGKLVFVRQHFQQYLEWAIKKKGAVGFITDFMREETGVRNRYDMLDIVNYTSFWWKHTEDEPKTFGFVLSPRAGEELAKLCRETLSKHEADTNYPKYPRVSCYIDSSLYEGQIEAVETLLPGEAEEEIFVISHLCHPRSSANDNASGVAASMELAKVLRDMTSSGKLLPLKRSVRICFIPEFTGTYAYLDDLGSSKDKIKAGINLDMVGGRQEKGYGPITISGLPHAAPSFITDLAGLVLDEVKKEVISHNKDNYVAMFNSCVTEFEAGSDNFILSDPTVGIPTIMLGQWPDINYHTSGDIAEQVDPYILHKSASIAASYVYLLSNLKADELPILMNKSRESMVCVLTKLIDDAYEGKLDTGLLCEKLEHYTKVYIEACDDYRRFFSGAELEKSELQVAREKEFLRLISKALFDRYLAAAGVEYTQVQEKKEEKYDYVPVRKYASPIIHLEDYALSSSGLMSAFKRYEKEQRPKVLSPHLTEALIQYYIDGKLTVNEIARKVYLECREDVPQLVHEYIQLLEMYGLVVIK